MIEMISIVAINGNIGSQYKYQNYNQNTQNKDRYVRVCLPAHHALQHVRKPDKRFGTQLNEAVEFIVKIIDSVRESAHRTC